MSLEELKGCKKIAINHGILLSFTENSLHRTILLLWTGLAKNSNHRNLHMVCTGCTCSLSVLWVWKLYKHSKAFLFQELLSTTKNWRNYNMARLMLEEQIKCVLRVTVGKWHWSVGGNNKNDFVVSWDNSPLNFCIF